MKKYLFSFFLLSTFYFLHSTAAQAAFVTIKPQGEVVWQVLGDETSLKIPPKSDIKITSVSELLTLNNENGKIILNTMDVSNINEDLVEIEARSDSNNIKIGQSNGQFMIEENGIKVSTTFPITIDPFKNEISVETASGNRLISILPYETVVTLMRNKLIDSIKENGMVLQESSKGELEYIIKGTKRLNLLNLVDINADVDSNVSASNGEVLGLTEPQWLKFARIFFE